ncbi:MAG: glycosyltransferase family 9 protein [Campylobacterales bacterium]|nr:glycosyltransferase family 9 protein [Campylobacterales bacterium]
MLILTDVKRVLILRCGALGDLIYATSVINALRMQYGETIIIDFITTPGIAKLFEHDPRVHQVFHLKHKKIPIWLSPQKRDIIHHSKNNPYDLFISLEFGKQFKSLLQAIHATHKTGMGILETIDSDEPLNRGETTKHYYRDVIEGSILAHAKPLLIGVSQDQLNQKFSFPENAIIIAPSNSHNQKKGLNYRAWPFEHWRSLIQSLSSQTPVIIVGARGEEAFFDHIKPYPENVIDMVGKLTISELITTVQNGDALICTDSATGHIGAAVDTPTFVLMGPNNPITDSPYQSDTNAVYPISLGLPCSPCYKTEVMKQCKDNICMGHITPEMVLTSLKSASIV